MPRSHTARTTGRGSSSNQADFEEIAPQHFLIRADGVRRIVKNEGTISGALFTLTTWRRSGLLARIELAGFAVLTLDHQVRALPPLPQVRAPGVPCALNIRPAERASFFDPAAPGRWTPIAPQSAAENEEQTLLLREAWVVRIRKGRGASRYALVGCSGDGSAQLAPLDETRALLCGYAQAAQHGSESKARTFAVSVHDGSYRLPDIVLPAPHRDLLARLGSNDAGGWVVGKAGWKLARRVYESLGLTLAARSR